MDEGNQRNGKGIIDLSKVGKGRRLYNKRDTTRLTAEYFSLIGVNQGENIHKTLLSNNLSVSQLILCFVCVFMCKSLSN